MPPTIGGRMCDSEPKNAICRKASVPPFTCQALRFWPHPTECAGFFGRYNAVTKVYLVMAHMAVNYVLQVPFRTRKRTPNRKFCQVRGWPATMRTTIDECAVTKPNFGNEW